MPTPQPKQWGGGETTEQTEEEAGLSGSTSSTKRHIFGSQRLPSNSGAGKCFLKRTR